MKLKNCKSCGRLFKGDSEYCTRCILNHSDVKDLTPEELAKLKYLKSKEIVYDNPDIYPEELKIKLKEDYDLDIKISTIMKYVSEGKLSLTNTHTNNICESCGKTINGGRYCLSCRREKEEILKAKSKSNKEKNKKSEHHGMFTKKK